MCTSRGDVYLDEHSMSEELRRQSNAHCVCQESQFPPMVVQRLSFFFLFSRERERERPEKIGDCVFLEIDLSHLDRMGGRVRERQASLIEPLLAQLPHRANKTNLPF